MKLGVLSFLAVLAAAPLAAQAAESQSRFAVTLNGSVVDKVTYEQDGAAGMECRFHRSGSGRRELRFRSVRPVTLDVVRLGEGVAYRPARLAAVRVTGATGMGSFDETRICRAAPIERRSENCTAVVLAPRRLGLGFARPRENRIAFRKPRGANNAAACGLDRRLPGGWLHLAPGTVDEDALLDGRSLRVVVRGRRAPKTATVTPGLKTSTTSVVRWTLTFRRLG